MHLSHVRLKLLRWCLAGRLEVQWEEGPDVLGEGGEWQDRRSWSVDGYSTVHVAKWEAGKANGPWVLVPHSGPRAGPHSIGRVLGSRDPCLGLATKMRVQGGVVGPCFAQL